jgi:hypothetical protein
METSEPLSGVVQSKFVEPAYFEPLDRLFREQRSESAQGMEEIVSFVEKSARSLMDFEGSPRNKSYAEALRIFCIALHQQLIDELAREDGVGIPEWAPDDRKVQARIRKTQSQGVSKRNRRAARV